MSVAVFRRRLFWIVVGIPNIVSLLYFGVIASPQFVSHTSVLVINPAQESANLSSLLAGASSGDSFEGAYILQEYIDSWEEYRHLVDTVDLRAMYGQGDLVSRFGGLSTLFASGDVTLWHYYQRHIQIHIDDKSNIVTLQVDGYSPRSAARLSEQILTDAVDHLDVLNQQLERDYVANAERSRRALDDTLEKDEAALADYRAKSGTFDPESQYSSRLSLLSSLQQSRVALASQLRSLSVAAPGSPALVNIQKSAATIDEEIRSIQSTVKTLSADDATIHQLTLRRDNDALLLRDVSASVQKADLDSIKNKYYLQVISPSSQPDSPERPRRLQWIAGVLLGSLLLWSLIR